MSLSAQDRIANMEVALKLFLQQVGHTPMARVRITREMPEYKSIYPTTWSELTTRGYLRPVHGFSGWFSLTGHGYRKALELKSMHESSELREMLGQICKHLKSKLKGRRSFANVELQVLARETRLEPGFITNVIEAQLIDHWFKQYGPKWVPRFETVMIHVPENFGLDKLPI
jgi:hypothetical protein